MFESGISHLLKKFAIIILTVGLIGSIALGMKYMSKDLLDIGIIVMFVGGFTSVLSGLILYGFGHLIARVDSLDEKLVNQNAEHQQKIWREDTRIDPTQERAAADYTCKKIIETNDFLEKGKCIVCNTKNYNLQYCEIETKEGVKSIFLCQHCKEKFKANAKK